VVEFEQVELMAPFKFYREEPRTVIMRARLRDGGQGTVLADCELLGRRAFPGKGELETLHFTGVARLARKPPAAPKAAVAPSDRDSAAAVSRDAVYATYFHGPAYQVLASAWRDDGHVIGRLADELPDDHEPSDQPMALTPRLIELCFQTAGLWEIGTRGRMALPMHIDRMTPFRDANKAGRLWAVVTPHQDGMDAEVVDARGRVRVRLEGYRTSALPVAPETNALSPIRTALGTR
jgi:hypothetical protein